MNPDTVTLCDDSTASPEDITFTHQEVWTKSDGWRCVGGVRLFRPDPQNKVVWIRARLRVHNAWSTVDVAFGWELLQEWMKGVENDKQ